MSKPNTKRKATEDATTTARIVRRLKVRHESSPSISTELTPAEIQCLQRHSIPFIDPDSFFDLTDDDDLSVMSFDTDFTPSEDGSVNVASATASADTVSLTDPPVVGKDELSLTAAPVVSTAGSTITKPSTTAAVDFSIMTAGQVQAAAVEWANQGDHPEYEAFKSHFSDLFNTSDDENDDTYESFLDVATTNSTTSTLEKNPVIIEADCEDARNMLSNKKSYLAKANLEEMIPSLVANLSKESKVLLNQLCPSGDCVEETVETMEFRDALSVWQEVLGVGGFAREQKKEENKEDLPFKDENFETYWGERLKRDLKKKLSSSE